MISSTNHMWGDWEVYAFQLLWMLFMHKSIRIPFTSITISQAKWTSQCGSSVLVFLLTGVKMCTPLPPLIRTVKIMIHLFLFFNWLEWKFALHCTIKIKVGTHGLLCVWMRSPHTSPIRPNDIVQDFFTGKMLSKRICSKLSAWKYFYPNDTTRNFLVQKWIISDN